jgi:GntR family transcriptional regulator
MQLSIDTADPRPIHAQIVDEVRRAVVLGTLAAGDPLPPVRHLAAELRVNPASVAEAYRTLEGEGLVAMRWGRGPVVAERAAVPGDRDALVRQVAERALRDARRHGIGPTELADAVRAAAASSSGSIESPRSAEPAASSTAAPASSASPVDGISASPSPVSTAFHARALEAVLAPASPGNPSSTASVWVDSASSTSVSPVRNGAPS